MIQNPQQSNLKTEQNKQKHLETVVKSIMKNQSKQKTGLSQSKPYVALFKDINEVLSEFDTSIGDCKKYNEAKIHRKYQIRIADLELQIKLLREKLREQQSARSPSKKYIEDLVDQLVLYKSNNQKQLETIQQLKNQNKILQEQLFNLNNQSGSLITSSHKQNKQKLLSGQYSARETGITNTKGSTFEFNLKNEVVTYLKQQQNVRKITQEVKSKFQHFLKKKIQNITHWSFLEFLNEIDKWHTSYSHPNEQKLSHRLRSNVLSTLEDELKNQKLPKIAKPYSMSSGLPYHFDSVSQAKRLNKRKTNNNYSKLAVTNVYRQKYLLK